MPPEGVHTDCGIHTLLGHDVVEPQRRDEEGCAGGQVADDRNRMPKPGGTLDKDWRGDGLVMMREGRKGSSDPPLASYMHSAHHTLASPHLGNVSRSGLRRSMMGELEPST